MPYSSEVQKLKLKGTKPAFVLEDVSAYGRNLTVFLLAKKQAVKHVNASLVAIEKKDPYTTVQKLTYNKNNLQVMSVDALGNVTTFSYDRNNRLEATVDPEGHKTGQSYDNNGNLQTKTDGRGNATNYVYDELNRLKSVVNPKGEITSYTYDLNGNKLTQTDGNGNTTIFQYNVRNKLIKKIDPNGQGNSSKTERYTYTADGQVREYTDRNSKTTCYTYDIYGRLTNKSIGNESISYTYDKNGNQLTMTDKTGTTVRTYDELGRATSKDVPGIGKSIYVYDIIAGVPEGCTGETTTDPKGNSTLKINDRVGRLSSVTADGKTTAYTYYENGSRKNVAYPNGETENYTYYGNNLLKELVNKKADGSIMDDYTYAYDEANNQISKHELVKGVDKGTTSYTYDSLNRLEKVNEPGRTTGYTYDKAGNRLTETVSNTSEAAITTYAYNEQNRLMTTVTQRDNETQKVTYRYDPNGNMISKEQATVKSLNPGSNGTTGSSLSITGSVAGKAGEHWKTTYQYDSWNQLVKTLSDKTITYAYNGEGQRVEKNTDGQVTRYLYEADKVILETNGEGQQTARNIYGLNLIAKTMDSQTLYYMYNGHADVTALIGTDGTVAATYYYDAFGTITEQTGAVDNNITYAGYQYDKETGLYYLNARYYDSKIARFISEDTYTGEDNDPLSLNLYTYCHNEPIMYIDPTGHIEKNDQYINKNTAAGKAALDAIDKASNAYTVAKAANDTKAMEKAHQAAENARKDYAKTTEDLKYIEAKYGTDTKKAVQNIQQNVPINYQTSAINSTINQAKPSNIVTNSSNKVTGNSTVAKETGENKVPQWAKDVTKVQIGIENFLTNTFNAINPLTPLNPYIAKGLNSLGIQKSDMDGLVVVTSMLGPEVSLALKSVSEFMPAADGTASTLSNAFPKNGRFATVMPKKFAEQIAKGEGKLAGGSEAWITAADDLAGINTVEGAAKRLTLIDDAGNLRLQGDAVVEFEFEDASGIASPYNRSNPGFVSGGKTGGGAREWLMPSDAQITNVKIRYLEK